MLRAMPELCQKEMEGREPRVAFCRKQSVLRRIAVRKQLGKPPGLLLNKRVSEGHGSCDRM